MDVLNEPREQLTLVYVDLDRKVLSSIVPNPAEGAVGMPDSDKPCSLLVWSAGLRRLVLAGPTPRCGPADVPVC